MQVRIAVSAILAAGLLYGATLPARAASSPFADSKRGFSTKIPETMKQVPPKPNGDPSYLAAEFYDDLPKYKSSGSTNPEFKITWWSTPKNVPKPTTPGGAETGDGSKPPDDPPSRDKPPSREEMESMYGPKSLDDVLDQLIGNNTRLFGSSVPPMRDRWANAKSGKTTKQKLDYQYLEINATKSKKKDEPQPLWYLFVAKIKIERPTESVVVGFYANCAVEFAKDLGPDFLSIVKNFETKEASGAKEEEAPTDPKAFHEYIKKKKVIAGWKYMASPKEQYAMLYDEGVKDDLIKQIGTEIEAIRAQVYEKLFPPDKPVTAVSVIRVCKDKEQYMAYGGSPSSAGYWQFTQGELVFYKDSQNPNDALRVLYHEAFHQYIFYSVGALSPHSWFNEGHGDFFSGHNYKNGKFELGEFQWRKDLAASIKREKRTVPLKEWLTWDQSKYYNESANHRGLSGQDNYALGWNFIYFLRTTKNPAYQKFLETYFNTLKGLVTKARDERRKARDKVKADGGDPGEEEPEWLANRMKEDEWCDTALKEALKGVDLDQMEKDWLAF